MPPRFVLMVAAVFGTLPGLPWTEYAALRCSVILGFLHRVPGTVAFLGSALGDTVEAGPGSVEFDTWRRLYVADSIIREQRFRGGARYPARFILKRVGGLTAEEAVFIDGRLVVRIRAERISPLRYPGARIPPEPKFP